MRKLVEVNNEVAECDLVAKVGLMLRDVYLSIRILSLYRLTSDLKRATEVTNRFYDLRRLLNPRVCWLGIHEPLQ